MSHYIDQLGTAVIEMKVATISTVAKAMDFFAFTAGNVAKAAKAIVTCRTGGLMVTFDGTDPTATNGHYYAANTTFEVYGNARIAAMKFLREAGTDAVTTITLEK